MKLSFTQKLLYARHSVRQFLILSETSLAIPHNAGETTNVRDIMTCLRLHTC